MPQFSSKRRVHHSAPQMFDLVADVERYPEFAPLCRTLKIRQRTARPDGTEIVIADMTVSFKLVREAFTSRVTLDRPNLKIFANICRGRSAIWKTAGPSSPNPKANARSGFTFPTNSKAGCSRC